MTIDYGFFWDIANYGSANWRGKFKPKEIAENAYDYFIDFVHARTQGRISITLSRLLGLLDMDGSVECEDWAYEIRKELGLQQIERSQSVFYKDGHLYVKDGNAKYLDNLPKGTRITIEIM